MECIKRRIGTKALLLLIVMAVTLPATAQNKGDVILGNWINTPHQTLVINVFKSGSGYAGKVVKSTVKDAAKPAGFVILDGLKYNAAKNIWENGKVHAANSSRVYNANAKIRTDGTLEVKGYAGMKFISSTKRFKRVK